MQIPGSLDSPSKHGKGTQTLQGLGGECATASGIPKDIRQLLHGNVEAIKGTAESTCVLKASAWGCVVANGELARMVPTLVYVSWGVPDSGDAWGVHRISNLGSIRGSHDLSRC